MSHSSRHRNHRRDNNPPIVGNLSIPQADSSVPQQIRVGIPPPPDHIYKLKKNRQSPSMEVWGQGTISYAPIRAEYIDGEGCFVYYYGLDIPSKTVAPPEAIYAMDGVKRLLINDVRLYTSKEMLWPLISIWLMGKKRRAKLLTRYFSYFHGTAEMMVNPFRLNDGYYCKLVKEIRKFVQTLLIEFGIDEHTAISTGEIIGMMFEYDNAYRYRIQDILSETTQEKLENDFPNELLRLIAIQSSRETQAGGVEQRFQSAAKMLQYIWRIPSFRKKLKTAIRSMNIENCKMDKSDIYHTLLYGDYNVQGKTFDERVKILKEIHGEDMNNGKWPLRICIKQGLPQNANS